MKLVPLQQVSAQMRCGEPLPWGVRDAEGKLLLARGQVVLTERTMAALLERGVFVDAEEAKTSGRPSEPAAKKPENYFGRWRGLQARLAVLLRHPQEPGFVDHVRECVPLIASLAERNADLLIFLILRHDHSVNGIYGVAHSLHAASVCCLLAHRLGWPLEQRDSLAGAALTMNLSMIDLQGRLAAQAESLNAQQAEAVRKHPAASAQMLRDAGLDDPVWITAVEQHHEQPGGTGYPAGVEEPQELSQVLRLVDAFTAMHSMRAGRGAVPAQQVARQIYTSSNGHAIAALLIKEFGIYPPGCYVRLASGETAVVIRRSESAAKPQVCVVLNRNGDPMAVPARRDTAHPDYAIVETVDEKAVKVRVPAEAFFATELIA